ncbi:putative HTH-type transcriptional regulator YybR [Pelagimonas phthalicica]|uniref:Putative HTH-type transcriptional regulator YybR n=1 Tax=Pelagimonas phthalicica TaxID=1037362 RepID=A0A238JHX1_9RHOB|nr:helix-turn-helix domain-containing protein [Pelagimonas phthalicica]TDS92355.1 HxlR family transcriptional regulator [Pelagimonas phthalicica]SMX29416.1 putative HTH-type transcriptional regulator YybR [Pelagimonas phthalicica]
MTKADTAGSAGPSKPKGWNKEWNGCPVRYAAGVFGDKWSFVLLRDVLLHGKRYYGEFQRSEERISTNILANRLAHLVETGMLTRHIDSTSRNKVFYRPTAKSRALIPAFLGVMVWSTEYDSCTEAPDSFAKAFRSDPKGTIAWYEAEIDKVDAALPDPEP